MSLKTYKITLLTLGPVHIGSGEELTKTDFVFNIKNEHVQFINERKLIRFLSKRNLIDSYTGYLQNNDSRRANLFFYFRQQNIPPRQWTKIVEYSLLAHRRDKSRHINTISEFVKDGHDNAYIPGSSLKGALRSILTSDMNDEDEEKIFLSKLRVSDSRPIHSQAFEVYQKYDIGKNVNVIPLFRESVKPGQSIELFLTIEDDIVTLGEIKEKIAQHYRNLYNKHIAGFKNTKQGKTYFNQGLITDDLNPQENDQVIFLGGGVGFADKTEHYQLHDRPKAKREVFKQLQKRYGVYRKFKTLPENVPLVLKVTNDTKQNIPYLMGACKINIEEVGEVT